MPTGGEYAYGLGAVANEDPKVTIRRELMARELILDTGWTFVKVDDAVEVYGRHHTQWQQETEQLRAEVDRYIDELSSKDDQIAGLVGELERLEGVVDHAHDRIDKALELCDVVADVNGVPHVAAKFRAALSAPAPSPAEDPE